MYTSVIRNQDFDLSTQRAGNRTGIKNIDRWKKEVLVRWVLENKSNPYPSEDIKENLAIALSLTKKQVSNWFTNARKRNYNMMDQSKLLRRKKKYESHEDYGFIPYINHAYPRGLTFDCNSSVCVQNECRPHQEQIFIDLNNYCLCDLVKDLKTCHVNEHQSSNIVTEQVPSLDLFSHFQRTEWRC